MLVLAACATPPANQPAPQANNAQAAPSQANNAGEPAQQMRADETAKEMQADDMETQEASLGAPMFAGRTTSGEQVSLDAYLEEEKGLVIYFMASWCPTCAKNWEALNKVVPEYEDRVNFIAISVDPTDTQPVLEELAAEKGFVFATMPGNVAIANDFRVTKQTAKFAIDRDGSIVARHDGALSDTEWREFFEQVA